MKHMYNINHSRNYLQLLQTIVCFSLNLHVQWQRQEFIYMSWRHNSITYQSVACKRKINMK